MTFNEGFIFIAYFNGAREKGYKSKNYNWNLTSTLQSTFNISYNLLRLLLLS